MIPKMQIPLSWLAALEASQPRTAVQQHQCISILESLAPSSIRSIPPIAIRRESNERTRRNPTAGRPDPKSNEWTFFGGLVH